MLLSQYLPTLFEVKQAAQFSDGPSVKWMTVPRIASFPIEGASYETNLPSAVPVANPFGSVENSSMYFRYSSAFSKSGRVSGVSLVIARLDAGSDEHDVDAGAVNAKDCFVDKTQSSRIDEGRHIFALWTAVKKTTWLLEKCVVGEVVNFQMVCQKTRMRRFPIVMWWYPTEDRVISLCGRKRSASQSWSQYWRNTAFLLMYL